MGFFKNTYRLIKNNFKTLIIFELIYKSLVFAIAFPLFTMSFEGLLKYLGINYLANDTIDEMFKRPVTYLFILAVIFFVTFVALIDIVALIECYNASYLGQKMNIRQMFYEGAKDSVRLLRFKNTLMIIAVIFIIPATNIATIFGYMGSIMMPKVLSEYIKLRKWITIPAVILVVVIILFAFRWIFTIHVYALEQKGFRESVKKSRELTKGNYINILLSSVIWQMILLFAGMLITAIATVISFSAIKLLCPEELQYKTAIMSIFIIATVVFGFISLISLPLVYAQLSNKYYYYQSKKGYSGEEYKTVVDNSKRINIKKILITAIAAVLVTNAVSVVLNITEDSLDNFSIWSHPDVAAHRGSSVYAPENSIPAFEKAIEQGVDWIELDVHQTKDGVVVVTHDADIERIAGVDKNVYDMTYEEIVQYDVGSWFSDDFSDLRVSTLDEVVKICKGKVKLNIELKPTGHEKNFEKNVLDVIYENGIENECVVASMNANALKKTKELDESIQTLYVCYIAAGNIKYIEFADAYSVKSLYVTETLVKQVHNLGKKLFVWTVNDEDTVRSMMNMNADIIITDNPVMVQEVIDYDYIDDRLGEIVNYFFERSEVKENVDGLDTP